VLQGIALKEMHFALGAVMGVKKSTITQLGGLQFLLDELADDYRLGRRINEEGLKLALCNIPVECRGDEFGFREVWEHQVRWARTIRFCEPWPYFFSVLGNATIWPLAWFAMERSLQAGSVLGAALAIRLVTAASSYSKLCSNVKGANPFWLAPAKDILQLFLWAAAFLGNKVKWRGELFRVAPGGKLIRLTF
jgi:ceramide glucosyltransferase